MADSLQMVRNAEREKFLADSLAKAARYDQAITAYGQIKFGMTRDSVHAVMKRTLTQGSSKTLGAYNYSFTPIYNDEGLLYMLKLQSESESALRLESSVKAKMDNIDQIITTKYGEPVKKYGYPDDWAFVENQVVWVKVWEFDTKTIKTGVTAIPQGSRYAAVCWIYDDPLRVRQLNKGKDLLKSKIEKAADSF